MEREHSCWLGAIGVVLILLWGCSAAPPLEAEQKETVDSFLQRYLADMEMTEKEIGSIVAIGDPAVPYIIKAIGKVKPSQPLMRKHSDVDMVDCLARIGTPKAQDGICKILRHEYPGYYGYDRMQAAAALVRLGAKDRAPVLREAIAKHKKLVARQRMPEMQQGEIVILENALRMIEAGKGVRDTGSFGDGPALEYGFLERGFK